MVSTIVISRMLKKQLPIYEKNEHFIRKNSAKQHIQFREEDLLVSNCILRSIDCAKLEKTDVKTLNNSTMNDDKETMKAMKRQFKKQHL